MPVFVQLDDVVVIDELGTCGSEAAEADAAEQVEIDASIKSIENSTGGEPRVVEGSLDVVQIAWRHAIVIGGLV